MPIRLVCPACSAALSVRDEFAGRAVKCPKCGGVIPAAQPAAPPASEPATPPPAPPAAVAPPSLPPPPDTQPEKPAVEEPNEATKPKSGPKIVGRPVAQATKANDDADRPRRKGREDEEDEDRGPKSKPSERVNRREEEESEERPARNRRRRDEDDDDRPARGKKKGGSGMIIAIVGGILLVCCGGGVGLGYYIYVKVTKGVEEVRKDLNEFAENMEKANLRVTRTNYDRLTVGTTTRKQAEDILGPGKMAEAQDLQKAFAGNAAEGMWMPGVLKKRVVVWQNGDNYLLAAFHPNADGDARLQMKEWRTKNSTLGHSGDLNDIKFLQQYPPSKTPETPPIGPADGPKGGQDEEPPPDPLTEVTAEELAQAYKDNEGAASTKYKDKWLLVEGKVLDVRSGSPDISTKVETTMVKLVGIKLPNNRGDFAVWCYLHADAALGGWKLTRGQTVKLKGKCTGGSMLQTFIDLRHCRIESSGPDPSVNTTAAGLVAEFLKNADTANEKYRDKEVTIRGAVLESISGDLAIFNPTAKKGAIKLQVRFTGTPLKTLQELKPGNRVTFKARCGGLFGDKIANYDAYLVP